MTLTTPISINLISVNLISITKGETLFTNRRTSRARLAGVGIVVSLALLAAACGDDDDSTSATTQAPATTAAAETPATTEASSTPETTAASSEASSSTESSSASSSDPFATPNAATGDPVKLAFAYDGKTDTVDTQGQLAAAKAVFQYANEYLGGIGGHPIELEGCASTQQPSEATACVNDWIANKVPFVLADTSGVAESFVTPLIAAGIPSLWVSQASAPMIDSDLVFIMANVLAANFAAPAQLAKDAGATDATEFVIDVPAAADPAEQLMVPIFANAGATLDVVRIPPGTADMTPQIQAGLGKNPGLVHVTGNDTFCISAVQALTNAGYDGKIVIIPQCQSDAFNTTLKGKLDGVVLTTNFSKDPADPEVQLYQQIMEKYAPDTDPNGTVAYGGYVSAMSFIRALTGFEGDITTDSLLTAIRGMSEQPLPLASGITFKCDGTAVSFAKAFCASGVLTTTLDADGNNGPFEPLDVGSLLQLG